MTVKELATLTGVSVRTLHYYDEIGLLKPARVDAITGYRYYGDEAVLRMQEILFFRELDFPLKTIAQLLASPAYDRREAIAKQRELLILKRERLDRLINALDEAEKGRIDRMSAFDNHEYETARDTYAAEVKERFGNTDAYTEHQAKTASYSADQWQATTDGMNALISETEVSAHFVTPPYLQEELKLGMHVIADGEDLVGGQFTFISGVAMTKFYAILSAATSTLLLQRTKRIHS